jgi:hypothetical protein
LNDISAGSGSANGEKCVACIQDQCGQQGFPAPLAVGNSCNSEDIANHIGLDSGKPKTHSGKKG